MADAVKFVPLDVFKDSSSEGSSQREFDQPAYTRVERNGVLARFLRESDPLTAILYWLEHVACTKARSSTLVSAMLCRAIADIDRLISVQLNDIIHHAQFQQLEASWRGVLYLTEQTELHDREQKVKVKLLSLSWAELSKDINRAIDFDQSDFFKLIYDNEFDMPGGEPFGVLIGDYQISHKIRPGQLTHDLDTLKEVARTAAAAFAPFICGAHPSLFGVDHFSELGLVSDIASQFKQPEYVKWRALRAMEDARFLGVVLPQVLMRSPYKDDGSRTESFVFKEQLAHPEQDYLWGNAAFAFAAVLVRAYSESGWFAQIRGMKSGQHNFGLVSNLPVSRYETDKYQANNKPSVNLLVGHRFEAELSDNGFVPLSVVPYSDFFAFYNNASVQQAKQYDDRLSTVNARLSAMLQYILCVARFAHYIKVIGRDKVGGYHSAEQCEQELQRWLHNYTTASTDASNDVRARHPLREARIQVREKRGEPGRYYSIIQLQPHFQLDQMITTVKLVAELSPKQVATA
ncbi:type VI secretion system contractile sheath large subunit [Rheinheimera baltica]|uniref:Type VI secretion system contractile sheath large subunit n=1 Tax=Rheinheimera baltica TaxID=67576 RepID=A0ABT9HUI6_9GAMM|nr:type VI secretion system contractile sheath large subunit [Rheinheimera baltica]MDP5134788.1 type VI secretion system contractile sheath large subunit [Rheinheimera baltica]MDP5143322.1 type VI secretion system contractile sheath large subunit [Rheinheimera baltica]MDP5191420.1 type VI secretion system contractile sheath large subunit [Rheinheimera baltica]